MILNNPYFDKVEFKQIEKYVRFVLTDNEL